MKKVYIRTFGWPMGAVLYDYRALFDENLVVMIISRWTPKRRFMKNGGINQGKGEIK